MNLLTKYEYLNAQTVGEVDPPIPYFFRGEDEKVTFATKPCVGLSTANYLALG